MAWKIKTDPSVVNDPTYLEPRITSVETKVSKMAKVPNQQSWVATTGQSDFTITNGKISDVKYLTVYVGGVPQNNIILVNDTTFRISESLPSGVNVFAEWLEMEIPIGSIHNTTHELGGYDELDVTKLKNYEEMIASPLIEINDDLKIRAVNAKNPPPPLLAAIGDANYYNAINGKWYQDNGFRVLATDESNIFAALDQLGVPIFCPSGNYYAPNVLLNSRYFGKGAMIVCKEKLSFDATVPPSQQTGIRNFILGTVPQPVLNEFYGKGSGDIVQVDAYANTSVGENALANLTTGKRNTAIGFQAMKSNPSQYSNVVVGSDALSLGRFYNRSTAIGDNAMKWAGILNPITTRHELWVNENDEINIWQSGKTFGQLEDNNPNIKQIIQPTGYPSPSGATIVNSGGGFPAPTQSEDVTANISLGRDSLLHLVKGSHNVALGYQAMVHAYTTNDNVAIGNYALSDNLAGGSNTAVGKSAMGINQTGFNNVVLGSGALPNSVFGNRNTVIGSNAGEGHTNDNSIIIGYKAKHKTINRSRQLIIDYGNDNNALPFIYGEMDTGLIQFRATQLRLGGDGITNGGIKWTVGTGVPTANDSVGSMYTRTDGGNGSTLYVKEPSGWVAK